MQLVQKPRRRRHVVQVPQRVLQGGKLLDVAAHRLVVIQAAEELHGIAQLLQGDAQLVALGHRQMGEAVAGPLGLLVALVQQMVGQPDHRLEQPHRLLADRLVAPAALLHPAADAQQEGGVAVRPDRLAHTLIGAQPLRLGRRRQRVQILHRRAAMAVGLVEGVAHRGQQLLAEHVPVARRSQAAGQPFDLADQPQILRGRNEGPEQRDGRAQPAQRDAHLVHALRIVAGQRHRLVRDHMGKAGAHDAGHRPFHRRLGIEQQLFRLQRLVGGTIRQRVAALRLGAHLQPQRCGLRQFLRQVVEGGGRAALQLQLHLAQVSGPAVGQFDPAAVEGDLYDCGVVALAQRHVLRGPFDDRGEDRLQFRVAERAQQLDGSAVGDQRQVGSGGGHRAFPFATSQPVLVRRRLDGLDETVAGLAHPQRHLAPGEPAVFGVVIGAFQGPCRRRAGCPVRNGGSRTQPVEVFRLCRQLQFRLAVDVRLSHRLRFNPRFAPHRPTVGCLHRPWTGSSYGNVAEAWGCSTLHPGIFLSFAAL